NGYPLGRRLGRCRWPVSVIEQHGQNTGAKGAVVVAHGEIEIAVFVKISRRHARREGTGRVFTGRPKGAVTFTPQYTHGDCAAEVRHREIEVPITVEVSQRHPARLRAGGIANRGPKSAVAVAMQDAHRAGVVRHREVGTTVAIDVVCGYGN